MGRRASTMQGGWLEQELSKASRALLEAHEAIDAIRIFLTTARERVSMGVVQGVSFTEQGQDGTLQGPLDPDPPPLGVQRNAS